MGGGGGGGGERGLIERCCWCSLVAQRPSNILVHLTDGSAQTLGRTATLKWNLQVPLSISPSHSRLTSGQPVPALTLERPAPGRVAAEVVPW